MGLESLQAWRPSGPGGPPGLEALLAWRPSGPGGPLGQEALRAWRPCGPVTTSHHLNYYPFGWIRKLFQPFFLFFDYFVYDTFFFENSYRPNQLP